MHTLTKTYVPDWSEQSTWITRTPSPFARRSLFYVQEAGHFLCNPGYYTEHEGIHSYLVIFTLSGAGCFRRDGKTHSLNPCTLLFTDCIEWHSYKPAQSSWEMLWLHFNGYAAPAYYERFAQLASPVLTLPQDNPIRRGFLQLLDICRENVPGAEFLASEQITVMLTQILLEAGAVYAAADLPPLIRQAVADIDAHLADDLSLRHFSRTLCVDPSHFQKMFRKYMGMTPNMYIRAARINRAKELLAATALPVAEIADRCGFGTAPYFIRTFKQLTGTTPAAYRRTGMAAPDGPASAGVPI